MPGSIRKSSERGRTLPAHAAPLRVQGAASGAAVVGDLAIDVGCDHATAENQHHEADKDQEV